jgi:hypothetical protein
LPELLRLGAFQFQGGNVYSNKDGVPKTSKEEFKIENTPKEFPAEVVDNSKPEVEVPAEKGAEVDGAVADKPYKAAERRKQWQKNKQHTPQS